MNSIIRFLGRMRFLVLHWYGQIFLSSIRYSITHRRIKKRFRREKLRVLFVVGNTSKWKAQSVYDLMSASDLYEPVVVLTICDVEADYTHEKRIQHLDKMRSFFDERSVKTIEAYRRSAPEWIDLNDFKADLVFYHQPWDVSDRQKPAHVAKTSLTFYIPYYVPNYGDPSFDCASLFHRTLYGFFTLSQSWSDLYNEYSGRFAHTSRFVSVGHPALDYFYINREHVSSNEYVIYAPHWSIPTISNVENYSTFLWSGKAMLEYAKSHREFSWVFKPHPTLRRALEKSGGWTALEIDEYYAEWEKISLPCYDGNYYKLFLDARAMITDCGSFLMEFPTTGKPLIHLISESCKVKPIDASAKYFDSFYKVHNLDELKSTLKTILEENLDPMKDVRIRAARNAGLLDNNAASNILRYFHECFA